MLVVAANRSRQALGQLARGIDTTGQNDTCAVQDDRPLGAGQKVSCFRDRGGIATRMLDLDDLGQVDVDHLRPEIARDVDLRRGRTAERFEDHTVQDFGDPRRIAHFFLIADAISEEPHLLHFLETALADRLVGRLRRHQQKRRVVPESRHDRGDKVRDARTVLRYGHRHFAGRTGEPVGDHASVALMGAVPEFDARCREQIRDRHHCRSDNSKGMLDAVHLEHFYEGFFGRHFHGWSSRGIGVPAISQDQEHSCRARNSLTVSPRGIIAPYRKK